MMINNQGVVIQLSCRRFSKTSRSTQGVKLGGGPEKDEIIATTSKVL